MLQASDSDNESEDINPEDEVQEMYSDLLDIVNGLFEIAIFIQKPTPHNLHPANGDVISSWRDHDRDFVRGKYPHAKAEITDRLSSAISRRRALLTSREENFRKPYACHALSDAYFASSKGIVRGFLCEQASSDVAGLQSNTDDETIANSYETHTEGFTLVLPPSEAFYGAAFECPLCFFMIGLINEKSWMYHLGLEVLPYICIFENWDTAIFLYGKKDE
jgi:hypothetical protein